jgi:ADP-L-glycero-D-manno-heptose 6-epimerase
VGSSVRFSPRLNEEGRSDRVIVDRFGTGDK